MGLFDKFKRRNESGIKLLEKQTFREFFEN